MIDGAAPVNLRAVADAARRRLDPAHHGFFAGGAGDERAVTGNEAAFDRVRLRPRVLRGCGEPDLRLTLLDTPLDLPVLIAPTAFHRLAHPDGESGTARAAKAAGTVMTVSMAATEPVERIAATGARLWFQVYLQPDRVFTEAVVKRAEAAGCTALVVSADSPVLGRRERDLRSGFLDLPAGLACENMRDPATGTVRDIAMDPHLTWADIAWLRSVTRVPVLVKGILHPGDAVAAVEHGAAGIVVSNHGGRQLENAVSTLDALPAVVVAVDGRVPVLLDGGVRRGVDIVAALALGASAVAVGRPVVWGLAAGGEAGVRTVLGLLRDELARAMALCGAGSLDGLTPDLVAGP